MKTIPILGVLAVVLALAACSSAPPARQASTTPKAGGYYLDDGPDATPPTHLDQIPDAVPRNEPLHRYANRTYRVLGKTYTPQTARRAHRQEGLASWYGRRFHGKKTASGELYDMYAMTAAHPTLPIPSYARVTALDNGKSVVVRINDRGPFHGKRIIDLSYAAAHRLDYIRKGSTQVRVESIAPTAYPERGDASGSEVYLQVGAFSRADNARQLRDRLARELELDAGRITLVRKGSLHRVQLGPYPGEVAALADRSRVRERLDLNAVLVRRD
jgi:rare lipoprotein A